jgi:hypothetical protein
MFDHCCGCDALGKVGTEKFISSSMMSTPNENYIQYQNQFNEPRSTLVEMRVSFTMLLGGVWSDIVGLETVVFRCA